MQSAIGRYQLSQVDDWVSQRRQNVETFNQLLSDVKGIRLTIPDNQAYHACYKYYFFIELQRLNAGWDRDRIVAEIHQNGVPCFTGSCPEIYREDAFVGIYGPQVSLPVARELGETSVMMNVHPGITTALIGEFAEVVQGVMKRATS